MNRDEIARIYEKANGWSPAKYSTTMTDLERFAALVAADKEAELMDRMTIVYMDGYEKGKDAGAAAEREACARAAEAWPFNTPEQIAATIRARGQS